MSHQHGKRNYFVFTAMEMGVHSGLSSLVLVIIETLVANLPVPAGYH
jgi:hypothetical protein